MCTEGSGQAVALGCGANETVSCSSMKPPRRGRGKGVMLRAAC